jgi:Protein of unknown function DUF262
MASRIPTTKDIGTLFELFKDDLLMLQPDFQRQSVWSRKAKSFLVDSVLLGRPIPVLLFTKSFNSNHGRLAYTVVDGQQRLRAVFEFLGDRVALSDVTDSSIKGLRFSGLSDYQKSKILSYEFLVDELVDYSEAEIRDIFVRFNKYVVKLNKPELRHAQSPGAFANFVERLSKDDLWQSMGVFTEAQINRKINQEFIAEVVILLNEGAVQDKKAVLDFYYDSFADEDSFKAGLDSSDLRTRLSRINKMIATTIPRPSKGRSRFVNRTQMYSLVGALDVAISKGSSISNVHLRKVLVDFDKELTVNRSRRARTYIEASSSGTDNLVPRKTRQSILEEVINAGG